MSLLNVFNNPIIQSTFNQLNGTLFAWLSGFGMYSSPNTTYYYVMDYGASTIYTLNDEWKFISFLKSFTGPFTMITIGNRLYMTGDDNVWKLDQDLNILVNYNPGIAPRNTYRGISYSQTNGLIYVAAFSLKEIQVFNLDLTLIRRFSTSPHNPYSNTESSNQLYVGTNKGIILVYQNEIIINQINGCNGNSTALTSILFDQKGYMATSCDNPTRILYLFSPNGSFTGKSLTTPDYPRYISFDSKGRFFQFSYKQISIYN